MLQMRLPVPETLQRLSAVSASCLLALAAFVLAACAPAGDEEGADVQLEAMDGPTLRISTLEFQQDAEQVASLRRAIAKMRELDSADPMSAEFRTSFAYWSNTHGYFGTGTYATDKEKWFAERRPGCLDLLGEEVCDEYYAHLTEVSVPDDGFTDDVWGTCQHRNLNFLPWHRIYLYYFERTVREHSDDSDFALPYWDYYREPNPQLDGLALPAMVRESVPQPLYDEFRTPGLNADEAAIDPDAASAEQAFSFSDFVSFSDQLQGQPHGVMHCAVGQGCVIPDMGFVPVAGLDPVFYMHHSNIDRLWQCWLNEKAEGETVDLAWAKANLGMDDDWYDITYTFADENGDPVKMTIGDVFVPGKIDVDYDDTTNCGAAGDGPEAQILMDEAPRIPRAHAPMGHERSVSLRGRSTEVALDPLPDEALGGASPLTAEAAVGGQTFLILQDVSLRGIPALTYKVYVASEADPDRERYVATFNYFGVGHADHGGGEHGDRTSLGTLVYKVTSHLDELGVEDADQLVVRFKPTNLLSGAQQELSADREAGVDIGQVRLETVPVPE